MESVRQLRRFHGGMIGASKVAAVVLIAFLASSCGFFFTGVPEVSLSVRRMGDYDRLPRWEWSVKDPSDVTLYKYELDGGEPVKVESGVTSFIPDEFLSMGPHEFSVRARSRLGLWSRKAVSEIEVAQYAGFLEDTFTYTPWTPNDTYYLEIDPGDSGQWGLKNIGMPDLWGIIEQVDLAYTRSPVVVAVIDTGYTDHPDVLPNIDAANGYDFIEDTSTSRDGDGIDGDATDEGDGGGISENSWHGTAVSSVIAAVTDNGIGVAGIGGDGTITILPVRALGVGGGSGYDITQALLYAGGLPNDSGTVPPTPAKIINMSLGYSTASADPYMESKLLMIYEQGGIVVAASSNDGAPVVFYPASSPYTIAVGAVGIEDILTQYSNYGSMQDVVAPGGTGDTSSWDDYVIVASPDPAKDQPLGAGDYSYVGVIGTSFSAPHVSGVLALLCTVDDRMTLATALAALQYSSKDLGAPGWDPEYGYGRLDAPALFKAYTGAAASKSIEPLDLASRGGGTGPGLMSDKGVEPHAELADEQLIVRFSGEAAARGTVIAGIAGVKSTRTGSALEHLLTVEPGADVRSVRDALLDRSEVAEVFYNYRYKVF